MADGLIPLSLSSETSFYSAGLPNWRIVRAELAARGFAADKFTGFAFAPYRPWFFVIAWARKRGAQTMRVIK